LKGQKQIKKTSLKLGRKKYPVFTGEFWTAAQRQAANLHEIAYRACFKPALPKYFIDRYTKPGDVVYDPFSGRGTTVIEAALLGRNIVANDINPISAMLTEARLHVPTIGEIEKRLKEISRARIKLIDHDLAMFYHQQTFKELLQLKDWLKKRNKVNEEDRIDKWIRMVATNRLTGHSPGFFSVYTLPPNQAVSRESQLKINSKRKQKPVYRDVNALILKKSKSLMKGLSKEEIINLQNATKRSVFLTTDAGETKLIKKNSVQLTVTSPPFLDIVQYAKDNWLRCWFNGIDAEKIEKKITMVKSIDDWDKKMQHVFHELFRITKKGGCVAFETGEVRNGKVKLEEHVLPLGMEAGFTCESIIINQQQFTKTANIWGVKNNVKGTNSNRIVLFRK
jgi:DNA modification methylase